MRPPGNLQYREGVGDPARSLDIYDEKDEKDVSQSLLGTLPNKKNDIIWEFFPNVGPPPPPPPFGNPLSQWPFWGQKWPNMASLPMSQSGLRGPKMIPDDQYNMFLTIWGHFGPNLAYKKILGKFTKVLGFGKTPPPMLGKIPK